MNDLLFDAPEQPSPRLAWMRKHNIHVRRDPEEGEWVASTQGPTGVNYWGFGETEDEAMAELALKRGWKLWNEEEAL